MLDVEWLVNRLSLILNAGASQKETLEMVRELTDNLRIELGIGGKK